MAAVPVWTDNTRNETRCSTCYQDVWIAAISGGLCELSEERRFEMEELS